LQGREKSFFEYGWDNLVSFIKPDKWIAADLLQLVKEGNYEKIADLIANRSNSMFINVNDVDESPLQYALGICDIFTVRLFYKQALSHPEYLAFFKQQAENQKSTFDIKFVYDAYEAFKQQYRIWESKLLCIKKDFDIEEITEGNWKSQSTQQKIMPICLRMLSHTAELFNTLKLISNVPRKIPIHFLKEATWNSVSDCDLSFLLLPDYRQQWLVSLNSVNSVNGYCGITDHMTNDFYTCFSFLEHLGNDLFNFIKLYAKRIKQIEEIKKQLLIIDFSHINPLHFTINLQSVIKSYTNHVMPYDIRKSKIQKLMNHTKLTHDQAAGYLTLAVNTWVFQGQQLTNVKLSDQNKFTRIPVEIYFHILSFLTDCSANNSRAILATANKNLRDGFIFNKKSMTSSLFTHPKIENIKDFDTEAEQRYQNRIAFLNGK